MPNSGLSIDRKDAEDCFFAEVRLRREERFHGYRGKGIRDCRQTAFRSKEERKQDKMDRDEVKKKIREWKLQRAREEFYGANTQKRNPWNEKLSDTMF